MGYLIVTAAVLVAIAVFFKPDLIERVLDFGVWTINLVAIPLTHYFVEDGRHRLGGRRLYHVRQRQYVREALSRA